MPKILSEAQVQQYADNGYCDAVTVLTRAEVARYRADLEAYEKQVGHLIDFPEKSRSYLLFDWADSIVHHPKVLDAVEDVIGPNILVYHSTAFIKEANTPAFVLWHQDSTYFFLEPQLHVSAWVALSDATEEAGCMRFLPGSHKLGQLQHVDIPSEHNLIRRGQGVLGYDHEKGVTVPVLAGQLSLHHTRTLHTSPGNRSNDRRIGFGISYIPTSVRPTGGVVPSALLVRGVDEYKHFLPEQRMREPMSDAAVAAHREATTQFRRLQDAGFARAAS